MTLSAYAHVAALARVALDDPEGATIHATLALCGNNIQAKAKVRSYQIGFTSWRAALRRKAQRQSGNPNAETPFDVLTTRIAPAANNDGWVLQIFKPSLGAFELPVTSMSSGKSVTMLDGRRTRQGNRMISDHPRYEEYAAFADRGPKTPEEHALFESIMAFITNKDEGETIITLDMLERIDDAAVTAAEDREQHRASVEDMVKNGPVFG